MGIARTQEGPPGNGKPGGPSAWHCMHSNLSHPRRYAYLPQYARRHGPQFPRMESAVIEWRKHRDVCPDTRIGCCGDDCCCGWYGQYPPGHPDRVTSIAETVARGLIWAVRAQYVGLFAEPVPDAPGKAPEGPGQ